MWASLIAGLNSHFLWRLASGLLLLALLASGFALLSLGMRARAIVKRRASTTRPILTHPDTLIPGRMARTAKSASRALLLVLAGILVGGFAGYAYRNAQLISNNYPLSNVLVLQKFDDFSFRLQTEQGQGFNATLCPDSRVDWQPGEKLKVWNYEQRQGCKRSMGYLAYVDARGNRISYKGELANAGY